MLRLVEAGLGVELERVVTVIMLVQQPDSSSVRGHRLDGALQDLTEDFAHVQRAGGSPNDLMQHLKLAVPLRDRLLKALVRALELALDVAVGHHAEDLMRQC